jgi:hypothetical protein
MLGGGGIGGSGAVGALAIAMLGGGGIGGSGAVGALAIAMLGGGGIGGSGAVGALAKAKLVLARKMAVRAIKRALGFIVVTLLFKTRTSKRNPKDVSGLQQKCHIFAFSSLFL